jgi:UrcA family protein
MKTETTLGAVRTLFAAGALLALMFVASPALADPSDAPAGRPPGTSETRIVKYADLDLTRAADVATLYQRIEDTAKRVCTPLGNVVADDACLTDALARTIAKIGLPALTQVYTARLGGTQRQENGAAGAPQKQALLHNNQ